MAAYADVGGLGTKQGPPVTFVWKMPNLVPLLLPWVAVLALLAWPSNRDPRAWWIWVPLIALVLLGAGLNAAGVPRQPRRRGDSGRKLANAFYRERFKNLLRLPAPAPQPAAPAPPAPIVQQTQP